MTRNGAFNSWNGKKFKNPSKLNPSIVGEEDQQAIFEKRFGEIDVTNLLDAQMGFAPLEPGSSDRLGWMINMREVFPCYIIPFKTMAPVDYPSRSRMASRSISNRVLLFGGGREVFQGFHGLQSLLFRQMQGMYKFFWRRDSISELVIIAWK